MGSVQRMSCNWSAPLALALLNAASSAAVLGRDLAADGDSSAVKGSAGVALA